MRNLINKGVKAYEPCCTSVRPRTYGKQTSVWTLSLAVQVCQELGLTERQVSIETIRLALKRLGLGWQRAKDWITSPDSDYARKKTVRAKVPTEL